MKLVSAKALMVPQISMEPLTILNKVMYPYLVRDRFNYLSKYSCFNFVSASFNLLPPKNFSLNPLLSSRGEEIFSQSRNRKIAFIADNHSDTSAALLALYKILPDPDQLTVFSEDSLDPILDKEIKSKKIITEDLLEDLDQDIYGRVVFGFSGASLFEPEVNPVLKNYSWIDGIKRSVPKLTVSKENELKKAYSEYADLLGLDIQTFADLGYLFNFGCKWSLVKDLPKLYLYKSRNQNKGVHFYDTPEFEQYSLFNFESFKGNNTIRYRSPLKQYLYDCTGERSWLTKSEKYDPYRLVVSEDPVIRVRTDQGIKLYKGSADECSPCFKRLSLNIRESFRK